MNCGEIMPARDRMPKPASGSGRIADALLAWYDAHARDLPWRVRPQARAQGARPDPYRVWLSEVMLQQTTVKAVAPYFADFLARWPDVEALAAAAPEEVMSAWAGLGYYSRARNLHACAREIAATGGRFPTTERALGALPGVGPYTAAAVAAIAFDAPAAVIDGNVERVIARVFAIDTPLPAAKTAIRAALEPLVPSARPGDFAQALMDLGATVCTPARPACALCPVLAPRWGRMADARREYGPRERASRFETRARCGLLPWCVSRRKRRPGLPRRPPFH